MKLRSNVHLNLNLIKAIRSCNEQKILVSIQKGADPNDKTSIPNQPPLLLALTEYATNPKIYLKIIELLLAEGADPLLKIANKPIIELAIDNYIEYEVVRLLINKVAALSRLSELNLEITGSTRNSKIILDLINKGVTQGAENTLIKRIQHFHSHSGLVDNDQYYFESLIALLNIINCNTKYLSSICKIAIIRGEYEFLYRFLFHPQTQLFYNFNPPLTKNTSLLYLLSISRPIHNTQYIPILLLFLEDNNLRFYKSIKLGNQNLKLKINSTLVKLANDVNTKIYNSVITFLNPYQKTLHPDLPPQIRLKLATTYLRNELGVQLDLISDQHLYHILTARVVNYFYVSYPNQIKNYFFKDLPLNESEINSIIFNLCIDKPQYINDFENKSKLTQLFSNFIKNIDPSKISPQKFISFIVSVIDLWKSYISGKNNNYNHVNSSNDFFRFFLEDEAMTIAFKEKGLTLLERILNTIALYATDEKEKLKYILFKIIENPLYKTSKMDLKKSYLHTLFNYILKFKDKELISLFMDYYIEHKKNISAIHQAIAKNNEVAVRIILDYSEKNQITIDFRAYATFFDNAMINKNYDIIKILISYFEIFNTQKCLEKHPGLTNIKHILQLSLREHDPDLFINLIKIIKEKLTKENQIYIYKITDISILNRLNTKQLFFYHEITQYFQTEDIELKLIANKLAQQIVNSRKIIYFQSLKIYGNIRKLLLLEICKISFQKYIKKYKAKLNENTSVKNNTVNLDKLCELNYQKLINEITSFNPNNDYMQDVIPNSSSTLSHHENLIYKTLATANWKITHRVRNPHNYEKIIQEKEIKSILIRRKNELDIKDIMTPSEFYMDGFIYATIGPEKSPLPLFLKNSPAIEIDVNNLLKIHPDFFKNGFITCHWSSYKYKQIYNPVDFSGIIATVEHSEAVQRTIYTNSTTNEKRIYSKSLDETLFTGSRLIDILMLLFIQKLRQIGGAFYQDILRRATDLNLLSDVFCELLHPGIIEFRYPLSIPLHDFYTKYINSPSQFLLTTTEIDHALDNIDLLKAYLEKGFNPIDLMTIHNKYAGIARVNLLTYAILQDKRLAVEFLLNNIPCSLIPTDQFETCPTAAIRLTKNFHFLTLLNKGVIIKNLPNTRRLPLFSPYFFLSYLDTTLDIIPMIKITPILNLSHALLLLSSELINANPNLVKKIISLMEKLLENGVNPNFYESNKLKTALDYAIKANSVDAMRLLLKYRVNLIQKKGHISNSAISNALNRSCFSFIELVIKERPNELLNFNHYLEPDILPIFMLYLLAPYEFFKKAMNKIFPQYISLNIYALDYLLKIMIEKSNNFPICLLMLRTNIEKSLEIKLKIKHCINRFIISSYIPRVINFNVVPELSYFDHNLRAIKDQEIQFYFINLLLSSNFKQKDILLINLFTGYYNIYIDKKIITHFYSLVNQDFNLTTLIISNFPIYFSNEEKIPLVMALLEKYMLNYKYRERLHWILNADFLTDLYKYLCYDKNVNQLYYIIRFLSFIIDTNLDMFFKSDYQELAQFVTTNITKIVYSEYIKQLTLCTPSQFVLFLYEISPSFSIDQITTEDFCWASRNHLSKIIEKYNNKIKKLPYSDIFEFYKTYIDTFKLRSGVIFVTCNIKDNLHVYLGRKKTSLPFKGPLIAPGGFRDKTDNNALNGAIRELKEETGFNYFNYCNNNVMSFKNISSTIKINGEYVCNNRLNNISNITVSKIKLLYKYKYLDNFNPNRTILDRRINFYWFHYDCDISQLFHASDDFTDGMWIAISKIRFDDKTKSYFYNNEEIATSNAMLINMICASEISYSLLEEEIFKSQYHRFVMKSNYIKQRTLFFNSKDNKPLPMEEVTTSRKHLLDETEESECKRNKLGSSRK